MATTIPSPPPTSPHEEDNRQPPFTCSPPEEESDPSPASSIENVVHHHKLTNSNSKQPPFLPPSRPDHVESPNYRINPNHNPNSCHECPSPSSAPKLQRNPNPNPKTHQSPKDLSPSPPLTTGSPPLPLLHTAAVSSPSKPQISPWTHQETANLIQAYQEKWYSLKKGPLKSGQWEEVAITVAARCGYNDPTKSSKQCRHKIEKLRKRYRAERSKPQSKATVWNFFNIMDHLEKGPFPISSSPPLALMEYQKLSNSNGKKRKNNDNDSDSDTENLVNKRSNRSKNYNHHIVNSGLTRNLRFSNGGEEDSDNGGEEVAVQLAAEIKGFAEKFVKMENKKIEMMRDVERFRLEMENKKMEMIIESQQMLVETVNKAFCSSNKTQKLSAN